MPISAIAVPLSGILISPYAGLGRGELVDQRELADLRREHNAEDANRRSLHCAG